MIDCHNSPLLSNTHCFPIGHSPGTLWNLYLFIYSPRFSYTQGFIYLKPAVFAENLDVDSTETSTLKINF